MKRLLPFVLVIFLLSACGHDEPEVSDPSSGDSIDLNFSLSRNDSLLPIRTWPNGRKRMPGANKRQVENLPEVHVGNGAVTFGWCDVPMSVVVSHDSTGRTWEGVVTPHSLSLPFAGALPGEYTVECVTVENVVLRGSFVVK